MSCAFDFWKGKIKLDVENQKWRENSITMVVDGDGLYSETTLVKSYIDSGCYTSKKQC